MKIKALILAMVMVLVCLCFFACDTEKAPVETGNDSQTLDSGVADTDNSDTVNTDTDVSDTVQSTDEIVEKKVVFGDVDASQYLIVANNNTAKAIGNYISDSVKAVTEAEMAIVEEADESKNLIIIGTSDLLPDSDLKKDEFLIKFVDGDLYIVYYDGSAPYQAITTILDEELFTGEAATDGDYKLSADFEAKGNCGDYIIGDNEFNPFE